MCLRRGLRQRTAHGWVHGRAVARVPPPVNCPVFWWKLASFNASILVIFLAEILALQVSFSTKKESFNLELIKALKSGLKVSLSSFAPSFTRFD